MSKSTKMIAALGIVAGLGIATLPLGAAFAASGTAPQSESLSVNLKVTDGVAIALTGVTLDRTGGGIADDGVSAGSSTNIEATAVAGGPMVAATTGTQIRTSASMAHKLTATPGDLTAADASVGGQTADAATGTLATAIAFSGNQVAQITSDSGSSAYSMKSGVAATSGEEPSVTTSYTMTQIGANGAIYTNEAAGAEDRFIAYDFAMAPNQAAGGYVGTVTFTVDATAGV